MTLSSRRVFKIKMSKRCFRFKDEALTNHAPQKPGVYEFVIFDQAGKASVLYVGLAESPATIFSRLDDHLADRAAPKAGELFAAAKDVYFDYVADADVEDPCEFKDIAKALAQKHQPRFNSEPIAASGRHAEVLIEEID